DGRPVGGQLRPAARRAIRSGDRTRPPGLTAATRALTGLCRSFTSVLCGGGRQPALWRGGATAATPATALELVWKWLGNRRNPAINRRLLGHYWYLPPIPLWTSARSSPHDF